MGEADDLALAVAQHVQRLAHLPRLPGPLDAQAHVVGGDSGRQVVGVHHHGLAPLPPVEVDADPPRDGEQPGRQRSCRVVGARRPPGLEEGLLHGFLGQLPIP